MSGIKKYLLLGFLLLVSGYSSANDTRRNITIPSFRYLSGGQYHDIDSQTINTRCDFTFCYFMLDGREVKIRMSRIQVSAPTRRASQYFAPTRRSYSELSGGGSASAYQRSPSYPAFRSSYASCFRDRGREYVRRNGCTSGDRLSTRCVGSKSPGTSTGYCYRYVKLILQDCGAVPNYLGGVHARNAGPHLLAAGFTRLSTLDPSEAPVGAVIVYGNACSASHPSGHIEIKASEMEYISDYTSPTASSARTSCRPVQGIYIKM